MSRKFTIGLLLTLTILLSAPLFAQAGSGRYAVFLREAPAASRFAAREQLQSAAGTAYKRQIETAQRPVREELTNRGFAVTGSVSTLLNAIFVIAPASRVAELRAIPGVVDVVPLHYRKALLNRANQLVNGPAAWNLSGGFSNAGKGIKIAILDTGIDQNHPSLQDSSLSAPPGFPICSGADCAFTNSKVIVARSYIRQLGAGTDPGNPAADSRPDDYSPRDRQGHGTGVATVAAGNTATGAVTINGMAPKAWLGNYKIIGSPGVNDGTFEDIMVLALEDAINDGMDVISMSIGGFPTAGPLDTGAACGASASTPCDVAAAAFEAAAQKIPIVIAAGNDGQAGLTSPTFNSISSPSDAPSVIAAGATTNSHYFVTSVSVPNAGGDFASILASPGDSAAPDNPVTATLIDVAQLGNDGLACSALPAGSLKGSLALVQRGTCNFSAKMSAAVNAGAAGVIFFMADGTSITGFNPGGLSNFVVPAVIVGNSDGLALKSTVAGHANLPVTVSPLFEKLSSSYNQQAGFSSAGPDIGDSGIKPDVLAVGAGIYMGAESYDPNGILYSPSGYTVADGTSFATPMTAGVAALVKQNHPGYTGPQVKSALVNTATQDVVTDDSGYPVNILQTGAGKVAADFAIQTNVVAVPSSLSFGVVAAGGLPATKQVQFTNTGSSALSLSLSVLATTAPAGASVTLDQSTLSLSAGASGAVKVTLSGTVPPAGLYSGAIVVKGGSVAVRIPWMLLVGSSSAANLIPLFGDGNDGTVGLLLPDGGVGFKLIDANGVPIVGAPVTFTARNGAKISTSSKTTDALGIAQAQVALGTVVNENSLFPIVAVRAGGLSYTYSASARLAPVITAAGVVDAASYKTTLAPGSYITIFGSNLSDVNDSATTARLPLALDLVQVSFDVPSAGVSVPGRLVYVDPAQLVVQVPWELQAALNGGLATAQVKVTINQTYGNVVTVPIASAAPAFFESGGVAVGTDLSNALISQANPAAQGKVITLYANGLGPVNNQPASGDPAPVSPLATTVTTPVVSIGGQQATVQFSGLTPGLPGLYQLNVTVPTGLTAGVQPISITIGGQTSKVSSIPVK